MKVVCKLFNNRSKLLCKDTNITAMPFIIKQEHTYDIKDISTFAKLLKIDIVTMKIIQ